MRKYLNINELSVQEWIGSDYIPVYLQGKGVFYRKFQAPRMSLAVTFLYFFFWQSGNAISIDKSYLI